MERIAREFLKEATRRRALRFGDFQLKSGRSSPYFFNMGVFCDAGGLDFVGRCYAQVLLQHMTPAAIESSVLFGPAYKGIALALATAQHLYHGHNLNLGWSFDRKEAKDHGEGGSMIGACVDGQRVVIVDDVLSAGTATERAAALLRARGARPVTLLVAFDRNERGKGTRPASDDLARRYGIQVLSIVTFDGVLDYLRGQRGYAKHAKALEEYRANYGG